MAIYKPSYLLLPTSYSLSQYLLSGIENNYVVSLLTGTARILSKGDRSRGGGVGGGCSVGVGSVGSGGEVWRLMCPPSVKPSPVA